MVELKYVDHNGEVGEIMQYLNCERLTYRIFKNIKIHLQTLAFDKWYKYPLDLFIETEKSSIVYKIFKIEFDDNSCVMFLTYNGLPVYTYYKKP